MPRKERKPLPQIEPNPDQLTDRQVVECMVEVLRDQRGYEATVQVQDVRPNPFAVSLDEEGVESMVRAIRGGEVEPDLWVARLPDGAYVDVDTPHMCEAVRRAGLRLVKAHVVGTFTEADCKRIGPGR